MDVMKGDCIHACWLVMPTNEVHLWSVILGKRTEIDQCPHVISKSGIVAYPPYQQQWKWSVLGLLSLGLELVGLGLELVGLGLELVGLGLELVGLDLKLVGLGLEFWNWDYFWRCRHVAMGKLVDYYYLLFLTAVTPSSSLGGMASGWCGLGSPSHQSLQPSEPHSAASPGPLGSFPRCTYTR